MQPTPGNHDDAGEDSDLPDVSSLPLAELLASDESPLANSVRRLVAELEQPQEVFAAFGNRAG
jgi:FXSXX-COOH protein